MKNLPITKTPTRLVSPVTPNLSYLSAYEAIMYQNPNPYTLTLTTQSAPEPSTFVLAGMGLVGVGLATLRKKYRRA